MADRTYSYTQTNTISYCDESEKHLVDKREWERLKDAVKNCRFKTNYWEIACSVTGGIFASGLIQWLCLKIQGDYTALCPILLTVWITAACLSALCYFASTSTNKANKGLVSSIQKEINYIEDGFPSLPKE